MKLDKYWLTYAEIWTKVANLPTLHVYRNLQGRCYGAHVSVPQASLSTTAAKVIGTGPTPISGPANVWGMLAKTAMHQRSLPVPSHPPARTSPTTRTGVGKHTRVCQCTAAQKEDRSALTACQDGASMGLKVPNVNSLGWSSWQRVLAIGD